MKINVFKLFKKNNSIQSDFSISEFFPLEIAEHIYPAFISLENNGLFAYSTRFMIKAEDLLLVEELITQSFHKVGVQEKVHLYDHGKTLCYYRFRELNNLVIDIITNDNGFITNLNDLGIEPPSPDAVFPNLDLDAYGSLQGELAFWWDVYWEPFWSGLTEESRHKYIESNNLSSGAISFLIGHQTRGGGCIG